MAMIIGCAGTRSTGRRLARWLAGTSLALAAAQPAAAQTTGPVAPTAPASQDDAAAPVPAPATDTPLQAAPEQQQGSTETDIVVTGSRIQQRGFASPTPVTAVSASELIASAPSTIAAALNNLPSLASQGGPQANAGSQSGGQNFLNLRGLGQTRTLTLLDGHRFPTSSVTNTVDTNLLPSGLVERVDVVTGGASAAYGSDAVAGVVNFVLRKKMEGIEARLSSGVSQYGDNQELRAVINGGTAFAGGRGHVIASFEAYDSQGVRGDARASRVTGAGIINNPAGSPVRLVRDDTRTFGTYGGVVSAARGGSAAANAALVGTQFFSDGTAGRYDYGTLTTATTQVGGDGLNTAVMQEIARPLNRLVGYGRASYDVTDTIELYASGSYAYSASNFVVGTPFLTGSNGLVINRDNAFLPAAVRAQMAATGVTSLTINRYFSEFTYTNNNQNWTSLGQVGLKGKTGRFNWDVSYQRGGNRSKSYIANDILVANLRNAADAVVSPTTGQIVCRIALTNPSSNCVPFNALGAGNASPAAIDYATDLGGATTRTREEFADASISGELFEGWAGPIAIAAGVDYRKTTVRVSADAQSNAGLFNFGNPISWSGSYNVIEGFAELNVPLARDTSWAKNLEVNAAARQTHYSTSGNATTWKVGVIYQPISDIRLRVTRSRDIRAPNLSELYSPGRTATQTVVDPFNGNNRYAGVRFVAGGNPALQPEVADTLVAGVVLQPSFLSRFNLSVDYYDITIDHAIAALGFQDVIDRCFDGVTELCGYITRNASGTITDIFGPTFGSQQLKAQGIDFETAYRFPIAGGNVALRGLASYLKTLKTISPGATVFNSAGAGQYPHWRGTATASYTNDPLTLYLQGRFIGAKRTNERFVEGIDIDNNSVRAQVYMDGQISVAVKPHFDVFLNVQNILNHQPPVDPQVGNYFVPTNANLYDQVGRMYRIGVNLKF